MLYRRILHELLQSTHGSIGAIFLDEEGESVDVFTERPFDADDHDLRVIGAYQGIFLSQLKRLCDVTEGGRPERFKMQFERMTVFISDLKDGYYLVLVVDPTASEAVAWRQLAVCREKLLAEM